MRPTGRNDSARERKRGQGHGPTTGTTEEIGETTDSGSGGGGGGTAAAAHSNNTASSSGPTSGPASGGNGINSNNSSGHHHGGLSKKNSDIEAPPGSGSKLHSNHHSSSGHSHNSSNNSCMAMDSLVRMVTATFAALYSIKFAVLVILSLQNSLFTVLRRYSQGVLKEVYSKYEVLMVGEIIKLVVSAYMIHRNMAETAAVNLASGVANTNTSVNNNNSLTLTDGNDDGSGSVSIERKTPPQQHNVQLLTQRLRFIVFHAGKMAGLALIYGAMNILSFVALRNIGAGLFTIFAQCKIFTTALFSALLLNRKYSANQWRALVALILGVLLFSESTWGDSTQLLKHDDDKANTLLGVSAVVTEVTLSGFASIYFEKVIKTDPLQMSIWERNFQLALGSIPVYIAFMLWNGGGSAGYFGGWTAVAWLVALLGAAGGLLVALSIKYGDAILKTLATTASIILSTVLEWKFLDGIITPVMVIAGAQVVLAICNYTFDPTPPEKLVSNSSSLSAPSTLSSSDSAKRDGLKHSDRNLSVDDKDDDDDDGNEGIPLMQRQSQR